MNWEHRLREMVLAGGALAVAACGDNGSSVSEAGIGSEAGVGSDAGALAPDSGAIGPGAFCCNANGDPCCPVLYCDAAMSAACSAEMACQAEGGTWSFGVQDCSFPGDGGPSDAPADGAPSDAPADAAPSDAPSDASTGCDAPFFCCNLNPDPCCQYLHCCGPLTATCSQELACQAEGGTWNLGTGCSHDGGQTD
jgi:hypothetical protein